LQTLIAAAQDLPPLEQLELVSIISQSLYHNYRQTQHAQSFWLPTTIEQLVQAQQPAPVTHLDDLKAPFWPADESADDFIAYVYQQRHEDRLRD